MSSFEKFKEKLPDQNEFYSSSSGKGSGDKEYQHVLKVWNKFGMKPMKDSHDLYLTVMFYRQLMSLRKLEIDA